MVASGLPVRPPVDGFMNSAFCRYLLILLLILLLPPTVAWPTPENPISVTDFRGKQLVFQRPVQRVVCLIESALSGIYMLRQGERVVGISSNVYQEPLFSYYAVLDERIRGRRLPAPGNWDFVSLEGVMALQPEVVILWAQQTEVITALEERGIPVFGVFIQSRADIDREMQALGAMLGAPERAAQVIAFVHQQAARITDRVAQIPWEARPGVYYMWAQSPLETSGSPSMVNDLIVLAGGRNVCGHLEREHLAVRLEQVLLWNPEVIIMWHNPRLPPQEIMAEEQWRLLAAVQRGRVFQLPPVFLTDLWTLKYLLALQQVAVWLHPQFFADLDLQEARRQIFLELYGVAFED